MKFVFTLFISLLLAACSAPSNRDRLEISDGVRKEVEAEGQVVANDGKSKVKCERIKKTGSHMVTRVCYTEEEWAQRERQNRDALEKATSRNTCLGDLCGSDG